MGHLHSVYDSDMHFSIDPTTRIIRNESSKTTLIQYDHNSERFTFELPRYIEGHDMTMCDSVQVHYTNESNTGVYEVDDMQISPADDTVVILSWLVSANATQLVGELNFLIRFGCTGDGGMIDYAWHTETCNVIFIGSGMNNGEAVVAEFPDVLEAWKREVIDEILGVIPDGDGVSY